MTRFALLAALIFGLAACTTEDNLGNHVFGDARWSVSIGSPGQEAATALAIDPIGNVIVAGTCDGLVKFGATRQECHGSFISHRAYDTGAENWSVVLQSAHVTSLDLDENGYLIATGSYTGTADIAGTPLTTWGVDPFIAAFNTSGALEGVAALGMDGTAVAPVGAIEPDGCVYVTGGFHGTMPTPDGQISNPSDELDGFVAGHFADASDAWTVPLSGEGDQVGRALAVQGEHLAVLAQSTGTMKIGAQAIMNASASMLLQFSITGRLQWTYALQEPSDRIAVARTGDILIASDDVANACTHLRAFDVAGRERWTTPCIGDRDYGALAIDAQGKIVAGGRSYDPAHGELFLAAYDAEGNTIGSIQAQPYPFERDSSLDGIAIEPTGEVAFIASINHPFDFGNGMVPFLGEHDVAIVKLDSPTGQHDGHVVLLR
jgi:hypothetical protein